MKICRQLARSQGQPIHGFRINTNARRQPAKAPVPGETFRTSIRCPPSTEENNDVDALKVAAKGDLVAKSSRQQMGIGISPGNEAVRSLAP